ncbi:MAG: glycosyltransferase family 4 protein [Porticoccaceae bacterium]|nr:glycosyltransferase family 4 protein [Porticoccaceae bacterium]
MIHKATAGTRTNSTPTVSPQHHQLLAEIYRLALIHREQPEPTTRDTLNTKHPKHLDTTDQRLLYDITLLTKPKRFTSIDRVVLQLLRSFIKIGVKVTPVVFADGYWRLFQPLNLDSPPLTGRLSATSLTVEPGDLLLLAEIDYGLPPIAFAGLLELKRQGLQIGAMVYDMFYLTHPHWFQPREVLGFYRWLRNLNRVADRFFCNSQHCAQHLAHWRQLASKLLDGRTSVPISVFPLGADALGEGSRPGFHSDTKANGFHLPPGTAPTFLTIAALHYRKGVDLLVQAFDQLWHHGIDTRLVISGINRDDGLAAYITGHPEFDKRLFYRGFIGDNELTKLAADCEALIVPSREEGFGLPIVEAVHLGLPVIANDIDVFREIADDQLFYFDARRPGHLATRLTQWLALDANAKKSLLTQRYAISWTQSARLLAGLLWEQG